MNSENRKILFDTFPRLYRDAIQEFDPAVPLTGIFWCRDGWFDLIFDLSSKIEQQARDEGLDSDNWPNISTVKEKFGKLVYNGRHMASWSEAIKGLIVAAKEESARTCELCGMPGTMRTGGVWRVRCDSCHTTKPE